jgi:hypothetical protein
MYGVEQHAERTEETKASDDKADVGCAEMGGALDDVRRDEGVSVEAGEHEEHEDAELPYTRVEKYAADGVAMMGGFRGGSADLPDYPEALVFGEPFGVGRSVREKEEEGYAEKNCGQTFDEKEPLPAAKAELAIEV